MLKNEAEWVNESIEYIVLGSSVCLPVFLIVVREISRTMIPLYKRLVESSVCKAFRIVEHQIVSERQLDSSAYLSIYK